MADKGFVFLLILFLMSGVAVYDRYVTIKGDVSPVARLIDFTGLADFGGDYSIRTRRSHTTSHENPEENLARLKEKLAQINDKRNALVQNREVLVKQLVDVNDKVRNEAQQYVQTIYAERKAFLTQFPELAEVSHFFSAVYPITREKSDRQIESELKVLIAELTMRLTQDPSRLAVIYQSLREKIGGESASLKKNCPDISLEQCFVDHPAEIKDFFVEIIDEMMIRPDQEREVISEASQVLAREYLSLLTNCEASDRRLQESQQVLDSRFQKTVRDMTTGVQADFSDLMALYRELDDERETLLNNVGLNYDRLVSAQQQLNRLMEKLLARVKNMADNRGRALMQSYGQLMETRDQLIGSLVSGEKDVLSLSDRHWAERRNFILSMSPGPRQDQKLATSRSNTQGGVSLRTGLVAARDQAGRPGDRISAMSPINISGPGATRVSGKDSLGSVNNGQGASRKGYVQEQMQRLRGQARDQGFYDRP